MKHGDNELCSVNDILFLIPLTVSEFKEMKFVSPYCSEITNKCIYDTEMYILIYYATASLPY